MSDMILKDVFNKIDFVNRYKTLCSNYDDFDNSMSGNHNENYTQIISKLGYEAKYFRKEHFYRIVSSLKGCEVGIQLTLKDGIVEPMLDVKKNDTYLTPDGRFDFIPKKMGVEFDRKKYNLPKYCSFEELESILYEIFSIYEDIKHELEKDSSLQ